jgi:predicted deacylase
VDSALELGKPGILAEVTAHMMVLAEPVAAAVRGTLNVMKMLGMIPGGIEPQHGVIVIPEGFTTNNRLRANAGGLVHHLKQPAERVRVGDVVAQVRTPLGEIVEEVRSPVDGFILSFPRFRNQAVMSGDHVVFIASTDS